MDKGKAIESALLQIEKKFGKGSIMRLGEKPHEEIGAISTNCLSLDAAIGVGGFPRGRIVEVYGPESSGKTTLALQVVAFLALEAREVQVERSRHVGPMASARTVGNVDEEMPADGRRLAQEMP